MLIRPLDPVDDRAAVVALYDAATDYVMLEDGAPPDDTTVTGFFTDRPPNVPAPNLHHFGMFQGGKIIGIAATLFGYPEPQDQYIGLLLFDPNARGQGGGARMLAHVTAHACDYGATRQLVAVLDANPKGRAFWEREGFRLQQTFLPTDDEHTRQRMTRAI